MADVSTQVCSKCGTQIADGAEFCSKCGTKVMPVTHGPVNPQLSPASVYVMLACLAVLGAVLWQAGVFGSVRSARDIEIPVVAPVTSSVQVTYRVFGSGTTSASLTYTNAQGGTEQRNDQPISPAWETAFSAEPGDVVYLSAQNDADAGSVPCEIRVDGGAFKHSVSTGGYGIASCSGSIP